VAAREPLETLLADVAALAGKLLSHVVVVPAPLAALEE
jgi:hypothetical protein